MMEVYMNVDAYTVGIFPQNYSEIPVKIKRKAKIIS